ncbi:MAG: 1-acyl-sn-glycerol-3-phosphate acyltransferase [Treponemataceae bacterium]|nr:1-acyl-sn-glycerol-3-phosphate acyltransferase [Treponemataceae bacterium]
MAKVHFKDAYTEVFKEIQKLSTAASKIDETNTYQKANPQTRFYMDQLVEKNTLPGSGFAFEENVEKFADLVAQGKRGLVLSEHYSNTDLPSFIYLLEHSKNPKLQELSKKIVPVAGMKLNEADPCVRAFTESFTRVVIYPTRSLDKFESSTVDEETAKAEELRARKINLSAMRAMDDCKKRGEVILVFPTGTRFRPDRPETKRGLREIDSYLRLFDVVLLVSVHDVILEYYDEDMMNDLIGPTKVIFGAREPIECKPFRKNFIDNLPADCEDPKQAMIDHVMELMEELHNDVVAKGLA